jgi:hypothetical protein
MFKPGQFFDSPLAAYFNTSPAAQWQKISKLDQIENF